MKIKLNTTIYFDGAPYPAGSIIDPDAIGANGDAIVHWMWGEPVDDDEPVAIVPVYSAPVVELVAQPVAEPIVEPVVESVPELSATPDVSSIPEPTPEPTPEPPPAPRRKRK
jgi:hypothetical protein